MECKDRNCPEHGTLSARGTVLEGRVVSDKMQGTVIVQRDRMVKVKKYDRYKKTKSRIPAHNPPCINAKAGDMVRIMECRKLAKTVSFVVIEKISTKTEAKEEAKQPVKAQAEHKAEAKKKTVKKPVKKKEANNG
jgi:small subunit ribosomal protein S17